MNSKGREYADAIVKEVESWPGVSVEIVDGVKHPKAKFTFTPEGGKPLTLARPFAGTPSDTSFGIHQMLGDMRRVMKQLGAQRDKPAPSRAEEEVTYRKPNDGAAKRPDPVQGERADPKPGLAEQLTGLGGPLGETAKAMQAVSAATRVPLTRQSEGEPARQDDPPARDARAIILEEAKARVAAIVDGVYFDLPADIYHAVPRLSASGLQKLCVSPATFWRNSWMDPERPELDEEQTIAQLLGKAYHTARLEPHLFESTYFRTLDKTEYPTALFTADQMKAVCEDIGLKKSGTKDELADRLVDHGYVDRPIWTVMERAWEAERGSRVALPAKHYDQMIADMESMKANGPIAELLTGGYAEVSIFWTDQYGIQMKQRVDYLAAKHWTDLKTYANPNGKATRQALADAVRYNRYYVQAASYRDGIEAVRVGGIDVVEGDDAQRAFITAMRLNPAELDCFYVFQEKGGVPNVFGMEFPFYMVPYTTIFHEALTDDAERREAMRELTRNRTRLFMLAQHEIVEAKKQFVLYSQVYADGTPWFPLDPRGTFTDEDFHPYWLAGDR